MLSNSAARSFEEKLRMLINNSGLTVSEAYYILYNATLQLKNIYDELVYKEQFQTDNEEKNGELDVTFQTDNLDNENE